MIEITDELLSFFKIPKHLAEIMLPYIKFREIKSQSILVEVGSVCNNIFLVQKGALVLSFVDSETGNEKAINFFTPEIQPFCTVSDSYFTGEPTQCRLKSIKNSSIVVFNKKDVDEITREHTSVMNYYLSKLNETLITENNFRMKLLTYSSERFYDFMVEKYPEIIQKIPSKYIAEFMGISREWLSKLKPKGK